VKIVAVDLQLMAPIPGVIQIHGDITKVRTNGIVCYIILAIASGIPSGDSREGGGTGASCKG